MYLLNDESLPNVRVFNFYALILSFWIATTKAFEFAPNDANLIICGCLTPSSFAINDNFCTWFADKPPNAYSSNRYLARCEDPSGKSDCCLAFFLFCNDLGLHFVSSWSIVTMHHPWCFCWQSCMHVIYVCTCVVLVSKHAMLHYCLYVTNM